MPGTNKLNIYLIKDKYMDCDSITKLAEDNEIIKREIPTVGYFYYKKSFSTVPEWIETFFKNHNAIDESCFSASNSRAVLIVKIEHKKKDRYFAIPFGSGRFLLKDDCYEERFGLVTSINLIESNSIRALDKKSLSTNPKNSREQIAKASEVQEFQLDFEKDLITSITGKSKK